MTLKKAFFHGVLTCMFFLSCNRYDAQARADQYLVERKQGALKNCKDWEAMSKFLHYYERYKEHINSYKVSKACHLVSMVVPLPLLVKN